MPRIGAFGGRIPKMGAEQLPEAAAQVAHNCSVVGGVIEPLSVSAPFGTMHDGSGYLLNRVPTADVKRITKPVAPSIKSIDYICQPSHWLTIWAYDWVTYLDATGELVTEQLRADYLPLQAVEYDEESIYLTVYLLGRTYLLPFGAVYDLVGPRYQFVFQADAARAYGGPDVARTLPATPTEADPEFYNQRVPLIDKNGNVYAQFEVVDVRGPRYDARIDMISMGYEVSAWNCPSYGNGFVTFKVAMNYSEARRRFLYYLQTMVTAYDEEGPPSEISVGEAVEGGDPEPPIIVRPGQVLTLNTPRSAGYTKNWLYRASTLERDAFRLLDKVDADEYTDWKAGTMADPVPPFGNYPDGVSQSEFLRGADVHPAQFAVALFDDTLYQSDFMRFHAWPEEFTIPFQETCLGHAIVGNTTVVFTTERVYAVAGSNPEQVSAYVISDSAPLLSTWGLCRLNGNLYWPTYDGLAECNGSQVRIVTGEFYTRKQWTALGPATMKAVTADGSVFLECASGTHVRIDLGEQINAITTYTSLSPGTWRWRSRRYRYDQPTVVDFVRVLGSTTTVKVYADGALVKTVSGTANTAVATAGLAHARTWEFELEGTVTVNAFEWYPRAVLDAGPVVELTAERVELWRNVWLKWTDPNRFVAGVLSAQTGDAVPISLTVDGALEHTENATSGQAFQLPRTMARGVLVKVDANTEKRVDGLVLFTRQSQPVNGVIQEMNNGPVSPWWIREYVLQTPAAPSSVQVVADSYPVTMHLYLDGSDTEAGTVEIAGPGEVPILVDAAALPACRRLSFDFGGDDDAVRAVTVWAPVDVQAGPDGWNIDPGRLRNVWISFADRGSLACGSIKADSYASLVVNVYDEAGALVDSVTVLDGHVFQFARTMPQAARLRVDVVTTATVLSGFLIPWEREPIEGGVIRLAGNETRVQPWLFRKWQVMDAGVPSSVLVMAEAAVTLRVFANAATVATASVAVDDMAEVVLTGLAKYHELSFDFAGYDYRVNQVTVFCRVPEIVNGPVETAGPSFRGLTYSMATAGSFGAGLVTGTGSGAVSVKFYGDGTLRATVDATLGEAFQVPRTAGDYAHWMVDVVAASGVKLGRLVLMPWTSRAVEGGEIASGGAGPVPEWWYTQYELGARGRLRSARVKASGNVTLRIYADGATAVSSSTAVSSRHEVALSTVVHASTVQFDFNGEDGDVDEVRIWVEETIAVEGGGLILRLPGGRPNWRNLAARFKDMGTFDVGRVVATSYSGLVLKLKSGGVVRQTVNVGDGADLKLAVPFARDWEIDLAHEGDVVELHLIARVPYRLDGGVVRITRQDDPWSWLQKRVLCPRPVGFQRARVVATAYPVPWRLYAGATLAASGNAADGHSFALPALAPRRDWVLDVVEGTGVQVDEVTLSTGMEGMRG